jgi:hypothetical protein
MDRLQSTVEVELTPGQVKDLMVVDIVVYSLDQLYRQTLLLSLAVVGVVVIILQTLVEWVVKEDIHLAGMEQVFLVLMVV